MFDIYKNSDDNKNRYLLGKKGNNPLIVVGLNPSIATSEKSDNTISKVATVAELNGFDGFVMINLYPVRATDYTKLETNANQNEIEKNISIINNLVADIKEPVFWLAWGDNIFDRDFFKDSCIEIIKSLEKYNIKYKNFGALTASGNPRHPSRLSYSWSFQDFDINSYIDNIKSK